MIQEVIKLFKIKCTICGKEIKINEYYNNFEQEIDLYSMGTVDIYRDYEYDIIVIGCNDCGNEVKIYLR